MLRYLSKKVYKTNKEGIDVCVSVELSFTVKWFH